MAPDVFSRGIGDAISSSAFPGASSLEQWRKVLLNNQALAHEHVATLPALLSELFFHTSIVQDDPYAFVSWMCSCKQLKQTSWQVYKSLRMFHRTWQLHVSACYLPSMRLCYCNECRREWSERGWICARFYRHLMWF